MFFRGSGVNEPHFETPWPRWFAIFGGDEELPSCNMWIFHKKYPQKWFPTWWKTDMLYLNEFVQFVHLPKTNHMHLP